jgi:ComF family protein
MILGGLFDSNAYARQMRAVVRSALPQRCFFCADSGDSAICVPCSASLPRTSDDACPRCQLPSVAAQVCGRCLKRPPRWNTLVAPWRYEFPMDRALVAGKRASAFSVYQWFTHAINASRFSAVSVTGIVAVPSSTERLQQRGYNHAELIAELVAKQFNVPMEKNALVRIRNTETQYHRNWVERRANVRDAFAATRSLAGQHVLLVDDVLTTGATLNELARVALEAGAASVNALVLARAQPMRRRERITKFGREVA